MRPRDIVNAWVGAFNRADVEALAGLYRDDAINHQVANEPVRGRAGYWDKLSFLRLHGLPIPS